MKKKVIAIVLAILMIIGATPVNMFASVYVTPDDIIEIDESESRSINSIAKGKVKEIPENLKGTAEGMVMLVKYYESKTLSTLNSDFHTSFSGHWCAWFIYQCAVHSGVEKGIIPYATMAADIDANAVKYTNKSTYTPKIGDLVLWDESRDGGIDHVTIIIAVNSNGIFTCLGGNEGWSSGASSTSNSWVGRRVNCSKNDTRIIRFARPNYKPKGAATPGKVKIEGTVKDGKKVGTNEKFDIAFKPLKANVKYYAIEEYKKDKKGKLDWVTVGKLYQKNIKTTNKNIYAHYKLSRSGLGIHSFRIRAVNYLKGDKKHVLGDPSNTSKIKVMKDVVATFKANGHTQTLKVPYGTNLASDKYKDRIKKPKKPGHDFKEWDPSLGKKAIIKNTTYKAVYSKKKYTVEFVNINGDLLKKATVEYKGKVKAPPLPKNPPAGYEGYTSPHWDKSPSTWQNVTGNVTIKAVYEWKNDELPISVSSYKVKRENDLTGYYQSAVLNNNVKETKYVRAFYLLKADDGNKEKLLDYEVDYFRIGKAKDGNILGKKNAETDMSYRKMVNKAEIIMADAENESVDDCENGMGIPVSKVVSVDEDKISNLNFELGAETTKQPEGKEGVDYIKVTKWRYRRVLATTVNSKFKNNPDYEEYGSNTYYSKWSDWAECKTLGKNTDIAKYETRYRYSRYTDSVHNHWCKVEGAKKYKNKTKNWTRKTITTSAKNRLTGTKYATHSTTCKDNINKKKDIYRYKAVDRNYYFYENKYYRKQTRTKTTVPVYAKFGKWSEYTEEEPNVEGIRQEESKTFYYPILKADTSSADLDGVIHNINGKADLTERVANGCPCKCSICLGNLCTAENPCGCGNCIICVDEDLGEEEEAEVEALSDNNDIDSIDKKIESVNKSLSEINASDGVDIKNSIDSKGNEITTVKGQVNGLSDNSSFTLEGKLANLYVYKGLENLSYKREFEYVGQCALDSEGNYSFSFINREEPSYKRSDYSIALGIEGTSDVFYIGTISKDKASYNVNFYAYDEDGELYVIDTQNVLPGKSAKEPTNDMSREHYVFMGWDQSLSNISEDTDIKPIYDKESYNVSFSDEYALDSTQEIVEYMDSITMPVPDTEVTGYDFEHWVDEDGNVYDAGQSIAIEDDMMFEAVYKLKEFTVTFKTIEEDEDGEVINETILSTQKVGYLEECPEPEPPTVENMVFAGWDDYNEHLVVTRDLEVLPLYEYEYDAPMPDANYESGTYYKPISLVLDGFDDETSVYYTFSREVSPTMTDEDNVFEYTKGENIDISESSFISYVAFKEEMNHSDIGVLEIKISPKAVTGLKLSRNNNGVKAQWTKESTATLYEVYRSNKKISGFKKIATVKNNNYLDKSAKKNNTYYYKVRAKNKTEFGQFSSVVKIKY